MENKGNEIIDPDNSPSLNKKMKAIVCPKFGPPEVLELKKVEKPTPKDNRGTRKSLYVTAVRIPVQISNAVKLLHISHISKIQCDNTQIISGCRLSPHMLLAL